MEGLSFQHRIKIAYDGQVISYDLPPPKDLDGYYPKVIISDARIEDLKLLVNGIVVCESSTNELEFSDLLMRYGEIRFKVISKSLFGNVVINVHKCSKSVYDFYL